MHSTSELLGYTCSSSLTMNEKLWYAKFYYVFHILMSVESVVQCLACWLWILLVASLVSLILRVLFFSAQICRELHYRYISDIFNKFSILLNCLQKISTKTFHQTSPPQYLTSILICTMLELYCFQCVHKVLGITQNTFRKIPCFSARITIVEKLVV